MKNKFWNEASRGGAILGLTAMAFALLGMVLPQSVGFVLNLASFVVTLYLLFYFTKRRADQFPKEGYSYAQCLGFIVAMGIFAGIIAGAYQIVASNFLFPEKYEEMYNTIIATYAQMGTFDNNMMDMMKTLMRSYLFSPIPVLITQVLASIFTYGFYGLFVALGTKREADIFDNTTEDDE
jgi:peptidoglycan biosynthesis protein MviN/MurJ (putative lipid II flippase)